MNVACAKWPATCYATGIPSRGYKCYYATTLEFRISRQRRRVDRISLYFNVIPTVSSLARRYPAASAGLTDYTLVHPHPNVCEKSSFGLISLPFI